jgi:predicted extracellular nuclease/alkaline phosphatase
MVSDGWGIKHIEATNDYADRVPTYQAWTRHWVSTYPAGSGYDPARAWSDFGYVNLGVTDSAAAATALYTGVKTNNGRISVSSDGTRLFTIGDKARAQGKAVGAVTSVWVSHATPAAWYAHNDSRLNGYAIAEEGFFGDPETTGSYGGSHGSTFPPADVIIGATSTDYVHPLTYSKLSSESGDPGKHVLVERVAGSPDGGPRLLATAIVTATHKLAGLFDQVYHLADGSGYNPENPTLPEMTNAALTVLSRNPNGFVLLVEGGAVDWAAHANNLNRTIGEQLDFDRAVQAVIDWVEDPANDSNWTNTLVIVTGDHETGYLTGGPGVFADQPLGEVSDATLAMEKVLLSDVRRASWEDLDGDSVIDVGEDVYWVWNSTVHTNSLIPLYTKGVGSEAFAAYATGTDPVRGAHVDNTSVFSVINSVLSTTTSILRGGIVLNEALIDPNDATSNYDTDGDGTAATEDEFVEIYNLSGSPIDIGGLELWDAEQGNWFTVPAATVLGPDSYAVVVAQVQAGGSLPAVPAGNLAFDAGYGGGVIDDGGDNVVLYDPASDDYVQLFFGGDPAEDPPVDYIGFSNTATRIGTVEDWGTDTDGVSLVREPAGDANVVQHNSISTDRASPGAPTAAGDPGNGCGDPATLIHAVQGSSLTSPIDGATDVVIEGVVVGDFQDTDLGGFYVQEEMTDVDADAATSEGIYVYDAGTDVSRGSVVRVQGDVIEYDNLTALGNVDSIVICPGSPSVAAAAVTLPLLSDTFLERFEGMLVQLPQTLTVSENRNLGRYGEVTLSNGRLMQPTNVVAPGSAANALQENNDLSRIILDDGSTLQDPDPILYPGPELTAIHTLRVGDTVREVRGVLSDSGSGSPSTESYRIHPVDTPNFVSANPRTSGPASVGGRVKVASLNVLSYFNGDGLGGGFPTSLGADTLSEFNRQRAKVIRAILALEADVIGLAEIENDGYGPNSAIQDLVDGLNTEAPPGTTYAFVDPGFALGSDPAVVGLMYRTETISVTGSAVTTTTVPFNSYRPPLAQAFEERTTGERFTVAIGHFASRSCESASGADADQGDGQGCYSAVRVHMAQVLTDWLATDPTDSGDPDYLIIGTLNAYAMEDPITLIEGRGYTDLVETYVGASAYSGVDHGQAGYLDHALANGALSSQVTGAAVWHINADEPSVLDYNEEHMSAGQLISLYNEDPYRSSGHDPVIVGLVPGGLPNSTYLPLVIR